MPESRAQFDVDDAATHFSRIIDLVEQGEEVIISRAGTPVVLVIPVNLVTRGRPGGSRVGGGWPTTR
ncbi:type II toxin-antitoxin system Phd/YefM family antitoxin [Paractinoplanes aksuensis]|uniref:type II toxin-antitoxin system Phd/YefM family antitoxin n=1 Tax=Paractinoplanes aksuensis TaxID=2939490 RepID=UPI003F693857